MKNEEIFLQCCEGYADEAVSSALDLLQMFDFGDISNTELCSKMGTIIKDRLCKLGADMDLPDTE